MSAPTMTPEYMQEDIGDKLSSAGISMLVIITLVFITFYVSRLFCADKNHWEIWIMYPLSYLSSAGLCITNILMRSLGGGGRHIVYLAVNNPKAISNFLRMQTGAEILYMTAVTTPRIALCLLYLRIFTDRRVRICTWIVIVVCALHWFGSGILAEFLLCHPYAYRWDKSIEGGWCGDQIAGQKYVSLPNLIIDLAIIVLPISTLYRLQISRTRKIGLFLTFMTGSLGIIGGFVRFIIFFKLDFAADLTYLGAWAMIITTMEPCAYFVCSCLPGIRPLARTVYYKSGLRDSIKSYYGNSKTTSNNRLCDLTHFRPAHGVHSTTITSNHELTSSESYDKIMSGFIRLEETVQVDNESKRNSAVRGGWDTKHGV